MARPDMQCPACEGDLNGRHRCRTCKGGGWVYTDTHEPYEWAATQWDARTAKAARTAKRPPTPPPAPQSLWRRLLSWLTD